MRAFAAVAVVDVASRLVIVLGQQRVRGVRGRREVAGRFGHGKEENIVAVGIADDGLTAVIGGGPVLGDECGDERAVPRIGRSGAGQQHVGVASEVRLAPNVFGMTRIVCREQRIVHQGRWWQRGGLRVRGSGGDRVRRPSGGGAGRRSGRLGALMAEAIVMLSAMSAATFMPLMLSDQVPVARGDDRIRVERNLDAGVTVRVGVREERRPGDFR